jgi:coenzyme F420-reducing hydrogenase delta subunit
MAFVFRAFSNGTDGVFIGGCHLNECHYITDGNHHAASMVQLCKKIMSLIGVNPERLRMESMSAGEGIRFAEVMNEFSGNVRDLGPLGEGEGRESLKNKLSAITKLIPYIRLVERERMRVRFNTFEEYVDYFKSEDFDRLFKELIADKLAISRILTFLREKPCSTGELSAALNLTPSEISRHLNSTAQHGYARFDESQKRFVPV